jgi:trehalose 6-phosphate synthase/phosphatase
MPKVVIVSNRLPVSVKKVDGKLEFSSSIGGLATGLASVTTAGNSMWIGWPGIADEELTPDDKITIREELLKHSCYPVFLRKKLIEDFYNEYSNRILWPLFHELEVNIRPNKHIWAAYKKANQLFAEAVIHLASPSNMIWVHDYQLLLVPELLRNAWPTSKIGFFLHIPFPPPQKLNELVHAPQLTFGLLGADLIGFHTKSYSNNFLAYCNESNIGTVLGRKVALVKRVARVAEFPIGIDYMKFAHATKRRVVQLEVARLRWKYRGKKVIVAFDRLDPTKGFLERLRAYRTLLREHPELHKKIILIMVANPSRTDVLEYMRLKEAVEKLVKEINSKYGTTHWQPIEYRYTTMGYEKIAALFGRADVGFIVPVRDGMNLVTKEYIASQQRSPGVLVLSETAGSAEELTNAVMVNPHKERSIVDGLYQALMMRPKELRQRLVSMQKHLAKFTADKWAKSFLDTLQRSYVVPSIHRTYTLNAGREKELLRSYAASSNRLFLLDYDGVLQSFSKHPADATPDKRVIRLLARLSEDPKNMVIIVSGRDRIDLAGWFGKLPVALAAEHGALFRRKGGKHWHVTSSSDPKWKEDVLAILTLYTDRTPGSFIEKKEWAMAWHYRNASPFYSQKNLVTIKRLLKPLLRAYGLVTKDGHKVIEVVPEDVNKARIAQEWLIHDHDFVLAVGDDATDEDMFTAIPPNSGYSIKIGPGRTSAKYRLPNVASVHSFLAKL